MSDYLEYFDGHQLVRLFYSLTAKVDVNGKAKDEIYVILEGRNEFTSMYDRVVEFITEELETDALVYDSRGQGKSSGPRGHLNSFDEYLHDLKRVIHFLREKNYRQIHFLAHSTGALVAVHYAMGVSEWKEGLMILSSPFFELKRPWWTKKAIYILAAFFSSYPSLRRTRVHSPIKEKFEGNDLTTDEENFNLYLCPSNENPEKCGPPTWGWIWAIRRAQKKLTRFSCHSLESSHPILFLLAGKDTVVDNFRIRELFAGTHLSVFPELKHALFLSSKGQQREIFFRIKEFHLKWRIGVNRNPRV